MLIPIYAKCLIYALIATVVSGICVSSEMEMALNEAALTFAQKWLSNPKMYIVVILPNKYPFKIRDVVKLTRKIKSQNAGKNSFFMTISNLSKYITIPHTQNELIWYPFETENYYMDCHILESSKYDRLSKQYFLFLYENIKSRVFSFDSCKVRFDSRLVIYHKKQNNNTIVEFKEIYKIEENANKLETNALAEVITGQKEILSSGLNLSIWDRRKSLNGKVFNAVIKNGGDIAVSVNQFQESQGKTVMQYSGYIPDIMRHLRLALNFSLNTTISEIPFNDVVLEVGSGLYDIGLNGFNHILARRRIVDFSRELLVPSYGLFYVKGAQKVRMGAFFRPFTSTTWLFLTAYFFVLISGFIILKMTVGNDNRLSKLEKVLKPLQTGSDIILRSIIQKRQSSEPLICSSKIAFLSIVFSGFLIFNMYRAEWVAFLAVDEDTPPIDTLKELISSDFNLAVREGGAMEMIFLNATPESEEYQLTENKKILSYSAAPHIFRDLMVKNDATASKVILFDVYEETVNTSHYPCKLLQISGSFRKSVPSGMLFKKNWQWTDLFNHHLMMMKESGLMDRLYHRNMKRSSQSCPNEIHINRIVKKPTPVDENKTFSLYLALAIGFATSLVLLLAEKLSIRQH